MRSTNAAAAESRPMDCAEAREVLLIELRRQFALARIERLRAELRLNDIEDAATAVRCGHVSPHQLVAALGPEPSAWFADAPDGEEETEMDEPEDWLA